MHFHSERLVARDGLCLTRISKNVRICLEGTLQIWYVELSTKSGREKEDNPNDNGKSNIILGRMRKSDPTITM